MRSLLVLHLLHIGGNIFPVAIKVTVDRSISVGVGHIDRFTVSVCLNLDPGHITAVDGKYMMTGGPLCLDINAGMEVVWPNLPEITGKVHGDLQGRVKGETDSDQITEI